MTDLNLAYSINEGFDNDSNSNNNNNYQSLLDQYQQTQAQAQPQQQQQQSQQQKKQQQMQQQQQQQQMQQQQQQMPITPQLPPMLPIPKQQQPSQIESFFNYGDSGSSKRYPEYSFWDRMVISKRDVLKLFILSIVIILGISIEKIGYHYISNYINANDLTTLQELLVRLSFPIVVFLLLWIIKSL